jgi:hypothetical protein
MTRSRSTGILLLRIGALAATLVVLAAAPASAAVIASSESGFEGGPALARDGRVVIGERRQGDGAPRGSGARRVLGIDPRTHAFRELAAFSAPSGQRSGDARRVLSLAGTGGIVTASLDTILELRRIRAGAGLHVGGHDHDDRPADPHGADVVRAVRRTTSARRGRR